MAIIEDKKLKNKLFYGFETLLDFVTEKEMKTFEDTDYELINCWEGDLGSGYLSANRYYYYINRVFQFRYKKNKDYVFNVELNMLRDRAEKTMYTGYDFDLGFRVLARDIGADNLYHAGRRNEIGTRDVVVRTCFDKINEIIKFLETKKNLMAKEINVINKAIKKDYKLDIRWFSIEQLVEEYGEEIVAEIKTKDKNIYVMSEEDYLKYYKIVKKFDRYARKNTLSFKDQKTGAIITFEQQDIKSYKLKKNLS